MRLLGLLGGGVSTLPAGYLAAEFLESTGEQYIDTGLVGASTDSYVDFRGETFFFGKRAFQVSGWGMSSPRADELSYAIVPKENITNYYTGYINGVPSGQLNVTIKPGSLTINGKTYRQESFNVIEKPNGTILENNTLKLGAFPDGVSYMDSWWVGKCYSFKAKMRNGAVEFAPVIDPSGVPCMFDKVTRKPFYNKGKGSFIVGITIEQARKLSKLPKTGGTLKVSLPSNYLEDEGVVNALSKAQENGWVITIQTYEAEAGAASTFALRRVWVRKRTEEQGSYVDADGTRWQVEWCVDIVGADPEQEGYEPFRSVESATEYWGLTEWVDPEAEQELLINNEGEQENE